MRGCREAGWNVDFACARGPWIGQLEQEGFRHLDVPMTRARSPWAHARAALVLASKLRRDPPDLIHTHTPVGGIVGRLSALAVPSVPVVHTLHGLPLGEAPWSASERVYLYLERLLARRTAFFLSQAAGDVGRAVELGIVRQSDTTIIGNGVDTDRFAPDPSTRAEVREELGIPPTATLAVSVGRLVREKGHLETAQAALTCVDVQGLQVAIVGEALPSDRTGIQLELDRHPVVEALGRRWRTLGHRSDVDRILKAADIFVLASHREGLPRSVIEAMASGLPVIATDIPACRELVEHEVMGVLVPVGDAVALASALRRLAEDGDLRRMMGFRARARALERHREEDVVARQLPVLARIGGRR